MNENGIKEAFCSPWTQTNQTVVCPLCSGPGSNFYSRKEKTYYLCSVCRGIFIDRNMLPDKETELKRYNKHNNDINDPGYQKFVLPIVESILRDFTTGHTGLDFGAGPAPVVSSLLGYNGFRIKQYDPFFFNKPELICCKYDYIVCCEVIEHFFNPRKEFRLLKNMLKHKGKLYCMTDFHCEKTNFNSWYYRSDPTHVFFYHEKTMHWIKKHFEFSEIMIENRLAVFSK